MSTANDHYQGKYVNTIPRFTASKDLMTEHYMAYQICNTPTSPHINSQYANYRAIQCDTNAQQNDTYIRNITAVY